ncbi:hypothetical protein ERX46_12480 [Brumimicrobium glaciale]|uniref:Outer membrane protein beta-barrel domain-containing protein n=1 Tax=Brumimicrobium glaciale TaxID=200475 RepID=A0A4Q4KJJ8_9FLAO|nr:hypothetical protein [Brumimicrobium glaciale]RYM32867.1 hypothetical protein ERX46_12480 [Brumimicrobium glaciale]
MKLRSIFASLVILSIVISSNKTTAQAPTPSIESPESITTEPSFKKIILQPYIGGSNMKKWAYDANNYENQSSKGSLHYGVSGEFMVNNRIGIGFDAIFTPFERTEYNSYYDPNTGGTTSFSDETVITENKLRILPKIYIHFNVDDPQWDLYISGGIGANIMFTELRVNGVEKDYGSMAYSGDFPVLNPSFPFAGRFSFGTRYYINDFLGLSFEFGVGGPPFSLGMNFRF